MIRWHVDPDMAAEPLLQARLAVPCPVQRAAPLVLQELSVGHINPAAGLLPQCSATNRPVVGHLRLLCIHLFLREVAPVLLKPLDLCRLKVLSISYILLAL